MKSCQHHYNDSYKLSQSFTQIIVIISRNDVYKVVFFNVFIKFLGNWLIAEKLVWLINGS